MLFFVVAFFFCFFFSFFVFFFFFFLQTIDFLKYLLLSEFSGLNLVSMTDILKVELDHYKTNKMTS